MRSKRQLTAVLSVILLMLFSFSAGAAASGQIKKISAYLREDFIVKLDGKTVKLAHPPLIYDGWSYVPLGEIGKMLNIDVRYEPQSKTVYINSKIKRQTDAENVVSEEFEMKTPMGYKVSYLGGSYPVLSYRDYLNKAEYLRLSDIQRMGIDTNGLTLAKDKITKELYVRRDEVDKLWAEPPKFNYNAGPLVVGESDQDKIDTLMKLPDQLRLYDPYSYVQMLVIDALPQENPEEYPYRILCYTQNAALTYYNVTLKKYVGVNPNIKWYINSSQNVLLDAGS